MRPETLAELAGAAGVEVPPIRGYGTFAAFAGLYLAAGTVLTTPDAMRRLVREVVEDAANDGAVWVEPAFYAPYHRDRLGPPDAVMELVLDAAAGAARDFGIGVGIIATANRIFDPADAVEQARLGARHAGAGVVGFGLANDETDWPPEPFASAFAIARDAGRLSVPHAGELAGPSSVVGALDALGADRIQHGVRAVEDPQLVQRLADSPVCLDVCPTSNLMLAVCESIEQHPLPALLDAGVACSVNADDSLLFGQGLLDEYELVRSGLGLDDAALAGIARTSIDASAAPEDLKARARAGIDGWSRT
jgi:adenosine deaminase